MKISKVTDYAALSGHSKIDKTKILMTNGRAFRIAYFWQTCIKQSWKTIFGLLFEWFLETGSTVFA